MLKNRFRLFALLFASFIIAPLSHVEAQRQITIDDIWTKGTFRTKGVPGFRFMNDGRHYTTLENNYILKYDLTTGNLTDTLLDVNLLNLPGEDKRIDDYTFSDDESQLLLTAGSEAIYRHSTKEWTYVYDNTSRKVAGLNEKGKQIRQCFIDFEEKAKQILLQQKTLSHKEQALLLARELIQ